MNKIIKLLNKSFPDTNDLGKTVKLGFFIGLFIAFFLFVFKPFGFEYYEEDSLQQALIFGGITFLVTVLFDLIMVQVIKVDRTHPSWTFKKWLIETVILVCAIGLANYVYLNHYQGFDMGFQGVINAIATAFLIGIFPIFFGGLSKLLRSEKEWKSYASKLDIAQFQESLHPSEVKLEGIDIQDIAFIESLQNYVSICHFQTEQLEKFTTRSTLKSIEEILSIQPNFVRCHRSYIVNKDFISQVDGNAQGLQLHLKGNTDLFVPVSRSYISKFK